MKIHTLVPGIFLLLIITGNIHAASFDCEKATSEAEKLICADQTLSKSDEDLAALYAETLKRAADPLLLERQQRAWLSNVRDQCIDPSILKDAYVTRIKQLSSVLRTMSRGTAKTIKSDAEACQVVVDFVLDNLSVPPEDSQPTMEELERIFGKDTLGTLYGCSPSYWRHDFNNDGTPDHLIISVQGTAHVSVGYVLSGKKGSAVQEVGDYECYDLSVLNVGTRYYVLSHHGGRLGKLWRLSRSGEFMPVCKFSPRKEPMVELVAGKENGVCLEARLGRVHHARYGLTHGLGPLPLGAPNLSKDPIEGLALVDINNDGTPDNVVRIDFSRVGGRGCKGRDLAVTDATRTKIPDTKLNEILIDRAECDSNMDVFVYEGIAYVDLQDDSGNRQIYRIRGEKIETICEFSGHLLYDVVDVVEKSEE
ncbi:lysozyme inhibitor LprI family protein [Desulfomonile tiedjei]|uniref:Lysozyme inhibitor LprI-like N-terminal domain-containing protein n=1 Tax=Desulfomonile tiedjei (strain ATCC 49306 / DSM 6799 / DCB-1) TaxID=706587 RepID=I4C5M1_DESTA|nr:lysozyme inhibitor LprI family protein [Desulfomonile tiedjei]AFM24862.1 hypothetical protein Desti_2165 [Desulfomonile tiedjei DSM 6799]